MRVSFASLAQQGFWFTGLNPVLAKKFAKGELRLSTNSMVMQRAAAPAQVGRRVSCLEYAAA